jgi:hypothetical protein
LSQRARSPAPLLPYGYLLPFFHSYSHIQPHIRIWRYDTLETVRVIDKSMERAVAFLAFSTLQPGFLVCCCCCTSCHHQCRLRWMREIRRPWRSGTGRPAHCQPTPRRLTVLVLGVLDGLKVLRGHVCDGVQPGHWPANHIWRAACALLDHQGMDAVLRLCVDMR